MVENLQNEAICSVVEGTYSNATIYGGDTEDYTIAQVKMICDNIVAKDNKIVVMPDNHPGKVAPIGLTMKGKITDPIMPALVGNDIGCGISVFKITKMKRGFEPDKLTSVIENYVPTGNRNRDKDPWWIDSYNVEDNSPIEYLQKGHSCNMQRVIRSIGTLGGGNHFIEIDVDDDKNYYLVIHSGSRYVGQFIYEHYMDLGKKDLKNKGIDIPYEMTYLEEELLSSYISDVSYTAQFATENRNRIASEICRNMKWDYDPMLNVPHNYIQLQEDGTRIVHKGSISAKKGEYVVIPVNMKDGVIIGIGKGNEDWNCSAPHGSGRLIKRTDVKNTHTLSEYKKIMKGIHSPTISSDTLDEAPFAYRDIDNIKSKISDTIEVEKILKPVYNYKGGSR